MSHLYKIVDRNGQRVPFKRNRAQEHFEANRHTFNLILKSRRLGFTTFEAVDTLDDVLFTRNFYSLFIAHTQNDAKRIFDDKVKFAWNNLPEVIRNLYKIDSDKSDALRVLFGDGTFSSLTVAGSGRSGTYGRVHVSEFGKLCKTYPDRADEIVTGTIPAVPIGSRFDAESTAEGEIGHFHDMFWAAWNRGEPKFPKDFKAHFYNWQWDDEEIEKSATEQNIQTFLTSDDFTEFDDYRKRMAEQGVVISDRELTYYYMQWLTFNRNWPKLKQEFPTTPDEAFIGSGNKMFDMDIVSMLATTEGKKDGSWTVFKEYLPGKIYVMGADVAEGVGQDSSTAVILDVTNSPYEVVATYANNKVAPDIFATELARYGTRYGRCIIAPEMNSIGYATVSRLKDMYENVYKSTEFNKAFETKARFARPNKTLKYGWRTTSTSKPKMLFDLKEAINGGEIIINDARIKTELRTYQQEDLSKIRFDDDQDTQHWDLLMALAIAFQMRTNIARKRATPYILPVERF